MYFDVNKQYLNYAGEYEIVCSGLETSEGIRTQLPIGATFTAAPYPIQLNGEAILEYSNGKVHLNANLIGSSSSKLEAVVILYDNNGRIQEITSEAAEWSGTNGNVSAEISAENVTNGYYARAYLIDITNNAFAPITEIPVELFINI